jgi:hypothetical protein
MFDKVAYWKNRKAGKRGQGEQPKATVTPTSMGSNRKTYRRKLRDRFFDAPRLAVIGQKPAERDEKGKVIKQGDKIRTVIEDKEGRPFTSKGVTHKDGKKPFFPSQDPNVPNKVRVRNQRIRSGRIKEND